MRYLTKCPARLVLVILLLIACGQRGQGDQETAVSGPPAQQPSRPNASGPSDADIILNMLQKKGVISEQDAKDARSALAARTNQAGAPFPPVWKISDAFKSIQLYGDVRLRYEYRGVNNAVGASPATFYRERMRFALRLGLRGDLVDDFSYGLRLETSSNPRSPWVTFGNNATAGSVTPSDKNGAAIYVGQLYLGWKKSDWLELTAGRMFMPLYTTPMVWDSDINPEGAFEKIKHTFNHVDLFAQFGQFDYQDPGSANELPSSDVFILAWQAGVHVRLTTNMSLQVAPVFYTYTGAGAAGNGLNLPFIGQGAPSGVNAGVPGAAAANLAAYNENGINDLMILEIPAEYNYQFHTAALGDLHFRAFGDFACNFAGDDRARDAYQANPAAFPGMAGPDYGQNKAYQVGLGIGSATEVYGPAQGLVYGSYSRKHAWEARAYWQHVEQYALDVNLLDSDFFEGRGNMQGVYVALAYGLTDAIIGTVRYGYASGLTALLAPAATIWIFLASTPSVITSFYRRI